MLIKQIYAVLLLTSFSFSFAKVTEKQLEGYWLTKEKTAVIHMYQEKDKTFSGKIVWLKDIHTGKIKDKFDDQNPDKKLQKRSLVNLQNVSGLKFDGDDTWRNGSIYDPKSGKTYSAQATMKGKNQVNFKGYVGFPLFGRTTEWTREPGKIPKYIQKK